MRIAITGIALPPIIGGLEVHIWELAKHLVGIGHDVHLFGVKRYRGNTQEKRHRQSGVEIHRVGGTITYGSFEFYEFAQLLIALEILSLHRKKNFDIVHSHCVYPSGISARVLNMLAGVPYVITSHGDEIMAFGKNAIYKAMRVALTRNVFSHASRVIAVSEELKALSIAFGSQPTTTLRMGNVVDTGRFYPAPDKSRVRATLGLPADRLIVLSLRRISIKNGIQYLVDAAPGIIQSHPSVLFLICGDGDYRAEVEMRVRHRGVEEYFRFEGPLSNESVTPYIQSADLAVFPSLAEATSIACLEALACGIPVVGSDVGGLPEIIRHGVNGVLVDFGIKESTFVDPGLGPEVVRRLSDAINGLLGDPEYRRRLGENASDDIRKHHVWSGYTARIVDLYGDILNG